ncbi:MAG: glycosyltransferase family 4 protein [Promethearchaeota archaeon]
MNITVVTTHLTLMGGVGKFTLDYANELCVRGHNITIVAQKIDLDLFKFNKKIRLIEVGGPLPKSLFYWFKFNQIKKKYINISDKLDNGIIFSQLFPSNYFCANLNDLHNSKYILYCHEPYRLFHDKNYLFKAPLFLKISGYFLKIFFKKYDIEGTIAANGILCNSIFTKNKVKDIYGKDSYIFYPILKMDNPDDLIDFNLRQMLKINKNTSILFTLGLSHHMKGPKILILIFEKILKEIPETILLIGSHISKKNKANIKKLAKKLKIPKQNLRFCGIIKNDLLKHYYNQSTLTFYTAIDEPFGQIPIESMKYGTPVIAFEGGGPSETILDGKTGYLIKQGDLNGFAQKAIILMKDKELYKKFSENAKKHVNDNFSFEQSVMKLESFFQKMLSKN